MHFWWRLSIEMEKLPARFLTRLRPKRAARLISTGVHSRALVMWPATCRGHAQQSNLPAGLLHAQRLRWMKMIAIYWMRSKREHHSRSPHDVYLRHLEHHRGFVLRRRALSRAQSRA